jgi:hypothetical protein
MATRAERFRYLTQRSGAKKTKKPRPPRRDFPVDTSKPGVSATDRKGAHLDEPNWSERAKRKATFAMEVNNGRPTRKRSRKSANRVKPDAPLRLTRMLLQLLTGKRSKRT